MSHDLSVALRHLGPAIAVTAVLAGPVALGQLLDPAATPLRAIAFNLALAFSAGVMGAFVLKGRPGHPVGRLLLAAGIVSYADVFAASWASLTPLAWLGQWLWWPPYSLIFLALLCFPDGQLPTRHWAWLGRILSGAMAVATLALAAAAIDHPTNLLTTIGRPLTDRASVLLRIAFFFGIATIACFVAVAVSLAARWRRADGDTRLQLACLAVATAVMVIALLLEATPVGGPWAQSVAAVVVPIGMTVAILCYRLYGLARMVNRALVWLVMSLLLLGGFCAVVVSLGGALAGHGTLVALVLTAVIAVAFNPLRRLVQRLIDRMLYGDTSDPYQVLARLGELLSKASGRVDVLSCLTAEIARAMRVPYVAVQLPGVDEPDKVEYGEQTTQVETFNMVAGDEMLGKLLVAPRRLGERFTTRERGLLAHGALHAAVAVRATQLVRDLEDSRWRLNAAEERERERIRRDLHDGVRATLRSLILMVWTALRDEPDRTRDALAELGERLEDCDSELFEVIEHLRPTALANGLAAALRAQCEAFERPTLRVDLQVIGEIDNLPSTIEVTAYRIVTEALHNVSRHAHARTCRVTAERGRTVLTLEIVDDGVGFQRPLSRRSGLATMEDRARELGGVCKVASNEPSGTAIRVRLPTVGRKPKD